jgi:hypothetical protein
VQDNDGASPLHYAICYDASSNVNNMLFNAYPEVAEKQTIHGDFPLLFALNCNAASDVINILFNAHAKLER